LSEEDRNQQTSEFELDRVLKKALKAGFLLGIYAGEHAASTKFTIDPFFITIGASTFDLIVALLLGNFPAALSWRYLAAEIGVKYRLTIYNH